LPPGRVHVTIDRHRRCTRMFQLSGLATALRLEHRHNDGSWSPLEPRPSHHDSADHDPERDWANGHIFVCTTCSEEVRVTEARGEGGPEEG
jgi:hypothetical protein